MGTEEEYRHCLDPDEMTPQERLDEMLDLLAKASVLLAEKEKRFPPENKTTVPTAKVEIAVRNKGRIGFGHRKVGYGRAVNEAEMDCVVRIQELASTECSCGEIARKLNKEDVRSRYAGRWSRITVWRILERLKNKCP